MHYTRHATKRFVERFPKLCYNATPFDAINNCFKGASLNKSTKNNTAYMVFLYERYGDNNFDFYENGDVLFICKGGMVVTVLNRNDPSSPIYRTHGSSKVRFSNRNQKGNLT